MQTCRHWLDAGVLDLLQQHWRLAVERPSRIISPEVKLMGSLQASDPHQSINLCLLEQRAPLQNSC